MDSAALLSKQSKDLFSELGSRTSKTEKGMDVGSLVQSGSRDGRKTEIERKAERTTDSWDAANNVGAIYGTAVPSIGGGMGSLDEDCVGSSIVGGDGDCFVQETMEVFDADSLVIATSGDMNINVEDRANSLEEAFESTAIVDDDQSAEADFEKDFLDEKTSEVMSSDVVGGVDKYKPSEVAHGIHEVGLATVVGDVSRGPEIDMENIKGAAEGPRENEFAVASDGAVGSDAVRALQYPGSDILATVGPEESETNTMQGFVDTHVPSRRRGMIGGEDVATER
jgi:hypothetical protein